MNLIKRELDKSKCNIFDFREAQYGLIQELIDVCFKYLETHGFVYNKSKYKQEIIDDLSYRSSHHFAIKTIKIDLGFWKEGDKGIKEKTFLEIAIPKLIEGQFFTLNGTNYIPQFYIADEPITIKKNSISLYSLFNPMTIYETEGRVIFLGNNIPISRFFNLYYKKGDPILDYFNIEEIESEEITMQNFSNIFNIPPDKQTIIDKIDSLFFDNWTTELYKEYYGLKTINVKEIINSAYNKSLNNTNDSFIDMNNKRLIFIEYLLAPLFKSITNATNMLISGSTHDLRFLKLDMRDIVKYFFNELKKANRYDIVNGFSGILNLKANFKNPKGGDSLPPEISNIHPSFKGKICPITISNSNPGESVTLVPEQNLRSLRYGIFDK